MRLSEPLSKRAPWYLSAVLLLLACTAGAGERYDRKSWKHWTDADRDCIDTRNEVLLDEADGPVTMDARGCRVLSGVWLDPYTGLTFTNPKQLDVDHVVPLAWAYHHGGVFWGRKRRELYANDLSAPEHLMAVQASANREKGAQGPDAWRPPNHAEWCDYGRAWASITERWELMLTWAEFRAIAELLATCPPAEPPTP